MLKEMENNFRNGIDQYPKTMTASYRMLVNYNKNPKHYAQNTVNGDSFVYNQVGNVDYGSHPWKDEQKGVNLSTNRIKDNEKYLFHIQCFNCNCYGHW